MISILLPTKGRPEMLMRCITSAVETAKDPFQLEFVLYIEETDHSYDYLKFDVSMGKLTVVRGPEKNLSSCYEWQYGIGPIYMMGADDIIFRTKGWDEIVLKEFEKYPDKIVLVYGRDGDPTHDNTFGTHSFVHRNWIRCLGRYLPPYFSGDFTDTWLNDIADGVGRKVMVDMLTEHMHPAFGKREQDATDKVRWEKHFRDNMPKKYEDTLPERQEDIRKLKLYIEKQAYISYDVIPCQAGHKTHETKEVENALGKMTVFNYEKYFAEKPPGYCPGRDVISEVLSQEQYWEKRLYDSPIKNILAEGNRNDLVLDMGCHIGWYTRMALQAGYPVYAFDGNSENLRLCRMNAPEATIREIIFNKDLKETFSTEKDIQFVKIDVEGEEQYAIAFLEPVLHRIHHIMMEVSPIFNTSYPALLERLSSQFEIMEHTGEPFNFQYDFTQKDLWLRRKV